MLNDALKSINERQASAIAEATLYYRNKIIRGFESVKASDAPEIERVLALLGKTTTHVYDDVRMFDLLRQTVAAVRPDREIKAEREAALAAKQSAVDEYERLTAEINASKERLMILSGAIIQSINAPSKNDEVKQSARDIVAKRPDLFTAADLAFPKD